MVTIHICPKLVNGQQMPKFSEQQNVLTCLNIHFHHAHGEWLNFVVEKESKAFLYIDFKSNPKNFIISIESYLSNCLQQTKIGCATSEVTKVPSGVPQGSVLGPVLFAVALGSLQIDDNASMLSKFADDTNCVFPLYKNQPNEHVQKGHSQILQWSDSHEMSLNNKKLKTSSPKKIVLHLEFISQIVPSSMN